MAIVLVNTNTILREWLVTAGTELFTLVGERVIVAAAMETAEGEGYDGSTTKFLELFTRGGKSEIRKPLPQPSVQIKCFGGSYKPHDAREVYRALYDRLQGQHGQETASGRILSAYEEGYGADIIDPDTNWFYVLSFWRVMCSAT